MDMHMSTRRVITATIASLATLGIAAPAAEAVEPSALCTAPTVPVVDGTFGGVYLRVLVQQSGSATWVCVRAQGAGTVLGGRVVIDPSGLVGGGTPSVDDMSSACQTTAGNLVPPPHPLIDGTVGGQHLLVDTYASTAQAWVCLDLQSSTKKRVVVPIPGVTVGAIRFEPDSDTPAPGGACAPGQTGVQPACVTPPGQCPAGQVGVQPACVPAGSACPAGQTGVQPACVTPPGQCPAGQVGVQPACVSAGNGAFGPVACVLDPLGVAGTAGVDAILSGSDAIPWVNSTDTGGFSFNGNATCGGVDAVNLTPILPNAPAVSVGVPPLQGTWHIAASGNYANIVCGTGTATGTATITKGGDSVSTTFGLTFVGGVGELSIAVTGGTINTHPINSGSGVGVIDILPNAGDPYGSNCITTNVANFFVNGAFAAVLAG
jgi:hypothetical protein